MDKEVLSVSQASVAQALAADYFCIYYVNTETDRFIEYSSSPEYKELGLPTMGDDLIGFSRNAFEEIIYPDDRKMFLKTFTKENIIASLDATGTFTMTFRMLFRSGPTHVHLKVTRMIEEERRHAVIGLSSVDEQMRAKQAFEEAHNASITYARVAQALAGDYFSIYVVDPDTDHFIEYSSAEEYSQLGVEKEGDDFFGLSRRNMDRIIYPEDRDRFMGTFHKERIMSILERDGSFTMKYRIVMEEGPVYVSMKATLLEDGDGRHLIIGTNNIDAQMKREEEYRQRMAEARASAKNDFLANMSHDIRTPMNAIVGYTNIAKSNRNDPELVAQSLDKIGSASHFLLTLINDVLDMSKIESGKMQLNEGECDLAAVFRRIEDITDLQAKSKGLIITYDKERVTHHLVLADELRIEQILINIVGNAIKYTPSGKEVSLTMLEEASPLAGKVRYRFIIRDTGIGISEEYLPHIFESFTREENTLTNRIQGTGLGLAITAKIVELMGGTISVKSRVGEGSEFTVVLDLAPMAEEKDAKEQEGETAADLSGKRILIVENLDINAEIAAMILEQSGAWTERARDGRIGYEMIRDMGAGYYDAVLMDIQMPVMNGYEATEAVRMLEGDYFQRLPIIAMSANAYDEDVKACLGSGMNAHIAKPFQPEDLLAVLAGYINS